ncbi:hypothetical protein KKB44_05780 [Candidatus Micrarchaeota archaeon]|nr:hypothetical protein [Candidatus Micrarchaeota archaeon]
MKLPNRYNGFSSFDAVFSILPQVLMLIFLLNISFFVTHNSAEAIHKQQILDKLVSIADYTVKIGAVKRADDIRYPNWFEANFITPSYVEDLRIRAELSELYISTDKPSENFQVCIYRLVVTGDNKQINRLFVCG